MPDMLVKLYDLPDEAPALARSHAFGVEIRRAMAPDRQRVLVRNLSLEVGPGRGLLIVGDSGSGKSSLARAGLLPALCLTRELADRFLDAFDATLRGK